MEVQKQSQLQQQQSMNGSMSMSFTSAVSAASGSPLGVVTLKCKNFLMVQLEFRQSIDDCQYVAKAVEILANLSKRFDSHFEAYIHRFG